LVDVVGEGISMIATQRSDFGGLLSRKGVDYFNEKLEKKVNKLMAGKK
jgi:ABC-type transporter MlaC component